MAKRQRSEYISEAEASDVSYEEKPKKKSKIVRRSLKRPATGGIDEEVIPSFPHDQSLHTITAAGDICDALLGWYSDVQTTRGMPWRKPYDPHFTKEERAQRAYEVWVSEIMLQQTQVATVIPYYNTWMAKFPTLRALAAAPIDEVNAVWKGLGYYSRASRLLAGAQKAVADYDGLLPDNAKDMEKNIPGVGRYTAGAICSIAYAERVPVLDGNVHRLLSRVLALHSPPKAKATLDILWAAADVLVKVEPKVTDNEKSTSLVTKRYPGDINQALIELGSTVCKVKNPSCLQCPLRLHCSAYIRDSGKQAQGKGESDIEDLCMACEPLVVAGVTAYPMKVERKKSREETDLVSVVEWSSSKNPEERYFLLVRRPDEGLLAGLYEFPGRANVTEALSSARCIDIAHEQLAILLEMPFKGTKSSCGDLDASTTSLRIAHVKPVGDVLHIFSHIRKTYRVQWVKVVGGDEPPRLKTKVATKVVEATWKLLEEVDSANVGTGVMKVWKLARKCWTT